jgi:hypothetical protein
LVACVCLAGCGGVYDSSVSGTVTLDGNPVTRGTVAYNPVQSGPSAYARIDEDGSYTVRTGREEGLPAGEYQVTVIANEPPAVRQTAQGGPPPPGRPITPPWYRTKQTSGLRFTVDKGSNEINLELTSQLPPGWNPRGQR